MTLINLVIFHIFFTYFQKHEAIEKANILILSRKTANKWIYTTDEWTIELGNGILEWKPEQMTEKMKNVGNIIFNW